MGVYMIDVGRGNSICKGFWVMVIFENWEGEKVIVVGSRGFRGL